jgi:hypothetical protein
MPQEGLASPGFRGEHTLTRSLIVYLLWQPLSKNAYRQMALNKRERFGWRAPLERLMWQPPNAALPYKQESV